MHTIEVTDGSDAAPVFGSQVVLASDQLHVFEYASIKQIDKIEYWEGSRGIVREPPYDRFGFGMRLKMVTNSYSTAGFQPVVRSRRVSSGSQAYLIISCFGRMP